ncbi:hypothetical protein JCM1841_000604 [Sporobolomyces salmonicolor]
MARGLQKEQAHFRLSTPRHGLRHRWLTAAPAGISAGYWMLGGQLGMRAKAELDCFHANRAKNKAAAAKAAGGKSNLKTRGEALKIKCPKCFTPLR